MSEQIALSAVFYFGQAFVFMQVNQQKRVGMVLLIICKEHTQEKIYKPF